MSIQIMASFLAAACFCAWLQAPAARVVAQTASVLMPQQAGDCQVVKKKGKGKSEVSSCTSVFVTVPAPAPPPPPPEDACKIGKFPFLSWSWLKCNYGAVSAVASGTSALIALWIGILAFRLNRNIRKGQVAYEQMKMLLEIDGELIDRPELWAVHGTKYVPAPSPSKDLDEMLRTIQTASPEQKIAAAQAIEIALSDCPDASRTAELRKLAFTTRYFNFFDILFANYGKRTLWYNPEKDEQWKAWRAYIKDFFTNNEYATTQWKKFAGQQIYSASFKTFMDEMASKNPTPDAGGIPPLRGD